MSSITCTQILYYLCSESSRRQESSHLTLRDININLKITLKSIHPTKLEPTEMVNTPVGLSTNGIEMPMNVQLPTVQQNEILYHQIIL